MASGHNTGTYGGGLSPNFPNQGIPGGAIKSKSKGRLIFKIVIHQASKFLLLLFSLVFASIPFQFVQYSFQELANLRALYHQFLQ